MNKRVMYHKKTGEPIQLVAQAQAVPNYQDVICFQELTEPYEYYVMERRLFFSTYVRSFDELPQKDRKQIPKHDQLPDKRGRRLQRRKKNIDEKGDPIEMPGPIGMGGPIGMSGPLADDVVVYDAESTDEAPADAEVSAEEAAEPVDEMTARMMDFFEARTYADRLRIFEDMKEANDHILTNIAVSLDVPLEDTEDGYGRILAELKLRKKYERDSARLDNR